MVIRLVTKVWIVLLISIVIGKREPVFKPDPCNSRNFCDANEDGKLDIVKSCLDSGAVKLDYYEKCAIKKACEKGHLNIVKFLAEKGVKFNSIDDKFSKEAPIIIASENGHLDVVTFLFDNGAYVTSYSNAAIRYASANGHLDIVKFLFDNGGDVTSYDNDALVHASMNNHSEVVKFLSENGADVTAQQNTAIKFASARGYLNIVECLVKHDADVSAGIDGASGNGHLDVVEFLVKNHADINYGRWTKPIESASKGGHLDVVNYLIAEGVQLSDDNKALKYAVGSRYVEVIKALVKTRKYSKGVIESEIELAKERKLPKIVDALSIYLKLYI